MNAQHLRRQSSRSLLALAMLGLCVAAQAAGPRAGMGHATHPAHEASPVLNTTLPEPELAGSRVSMPESHLAQAAGRGMAAAAADTVASDDAQRGNAHGTFPIQWRESREIVGPELVSRIRNYKRDGLPVVRLWEAGQSRVAIGFNTHGMPGIYFTHHVGG